MNENQPAPVRRRFLELLHSPVTAWTILLISTLLTGLGWWVSRSYVEQRAQERFHYEVDRAEQLILRQMRVFERMMIGARGLHYASEVATRAEWRSYVAALRLPEYYAGVQGFGFVRWVTAEDRLAYEASVRAEGFPDFGIKPPGERAEYACVTYIEPFEQRNLRAFGYDLWSEPVRRAGLSQARDTGKPALTGKMFLVQETGTNVQPGVIMLVPMYRGGQPVGTVEERRAALFGWVHAPFRIGDLMHGILGNANPEIGFDLFDGDQPVADAHLFNSDAELAPLPTAYQPSRMETRRIELAGRPWLLRFHTRPEFEAATDSNQPFLIAFGGLAIDGLLFAIIWSLAGLRQRAERLAERMTENYRRANGALVEKITEREQAEARLTAFSELGQKLSGAQTAREAGEIIVTVADDLIGWEACVVDLYSAADDRIHSVLRKDLVNGQRVDVPGSTLDWSPTPRARRVFAHGGELELRAAAAGLPADSVAFGNVARPSLSLLTVPIRNGTCAIGILSIQSYQPQAFTPQDLELLQTLADYCGGALVRIQAALDLRTSEERFRLVWENTADGLRLTDSEGRVIAANAAFCRLMGRPRIEVEGQLFSDLYAEADRARILARHRERFTQHKVPTHLERQLTLWDGRSLWLEVSNCFVETDPSRPLLLSSFRDNTPSRSLEEQLRQSQKMEAVGQLAGGIAHDFNNILGAILGNVELARTMPPGDPELKVSHDAIFTASQRAADLVKQILAFSRRQEQQRQTLQLAMVVREAVQLLRATVPAGVEFEQHLATVPTVLADASAIHQVAMNLCTNAWHALKGQPGLIRVELAETMVTADFARLHPDLRPGRYVRFSVTDNGCGMAAATQARIFEPFFTTKPVGEGTGLGLSVVHGIMKNHDGGILVTSAPGQGTAFDLYFPVFETEAIETAPAPAPGPVPLGAGEHILFVDDEEPMTKMGRSVLTRLGYRVTLFTNPAAAVAAFRAQPEQFDLVITDYNMPGMNGTTLGAQILSIRPEQRILLTTGFSADVTEAVARSLGFRELLPKPYDLRAIGEAVRRVLHASKINP